MKYLCYLSLILISLCISSCGGGGGGSGGSLNTAVGVPLSNYVVVNLSNGDVQAYSSLSGITVNDSFKSTHMVFKTISAGPTYYGQNPSDFGFQANETEGAASVSKYFISVFEVTQEQWERISGQTPWTSIDATALGLPDWSVIDSRKPACNLSYDGILAGLANFNSGKSIRLELPSNIQWEHACRASSTSVFSWGANLNTAEAGLYAVVRESFGGTDGPEEVGGQTANNFGLFDCHGNVWEMTSSRNIRGGSWYDNISQARCANKHDILEGVEHYLVGARLIFIP